MVLIPLQPVPNQSFNVNLNGQYCTLSFYTLSTGFYFDLSVNNIPVLHGVMCVNGTLLIRQTYLGFIGDLAFNDTQGNTDPVYTGLGTRYQLAYFAPSDL